MLLEDGFVPLFMGLQFSSVNISFLVHSTEDLETLELNVEEALGLDPSEFKIEQLEGHFGNVLFFVRAHITGKVAGDLIRKISERLTPNARAQIRSELERSMDEHDALFLRFDRQSLSDGLSISNDEPIRIKIKPKVRIGGHEEMRAAYSEALGLR